MHPPSIRALVGVPFLASSFAFLSTGFVAARGFVEPPTMDPVLGFHATSLLSLVLQLGLSSFAVIVSSSDVVSKTPQTMRNAMHLSTSC